MEKSPQKTASNALALLRIERLVEERAHLEPGRIKSQKQNAKLASKASKARHRFGTRQVVGLVRACLLQRPQLPRSWLLVKKLNSALRSPRVVRRRLKSLSSTKARNCSMEAEVFRNQNSESKF